MRIGAADPQTEARVQKNEDELSGWLSAGEFKRGNIRGNYGSPGFSILVSPGVQGEGVRLEFLDFPGGDLDPVTRNSARWAEVQNFLAGTTVLLIPVDATVFMERPRRGAGKRSTASCVAQRSPTQYGSGRRNAWR